MTFMNNYCRNDGSPVLVSVGSTIATGINIFLDWLFVFPLQKGLMGAAIATGISQTCGMLIVSTHFILRRGQLRVGRFRFSGKLARKLLLRGTPEAIAQFAVPVATLCTNYVLLARLGDMAVNAYFPRPSASASRAACSRCSARAMVRRTRRSSGGIFARACSLT